MSMASRDAVLCPSAFLRRRQSAKVHSVCVALDDGHAGRRVDPWPLSHFPEEGVHPLSVFLDLGTEKAEQSQPSGNMLRMTEDDNGHALFGCQPLFDHFPPPIGQAGCPPLNRTRLLGPECRFW
jgi:hypothetical protein